MSFHVGQKVVCVYDGPSSSRFAVWYDINYTRRTRIVAGVIYTIRDIETRAVHLHGSPTILLEELIEPSTMTTVGKWEPGFFPYRFRPIIERKTSISAFTEILDRVNATPRKESVV